MTGSAGQPGTSRPPVAAEFAALVLALLMLRCLPLRVTITIAGVIGRLGTRPAAAAEALDAVSAVKQAAAWWPGRAACLETPLAAYIALALRRRRADWCIGCRLSPVEPHAWIETAAGPAGEPDQAGRRLHAAVRT
ncbi:MAG: lasso peptide biosynthesis B2 protein [Nocardiopsaceae bacterium]|nr:lasso peptide biosynthesis B2 protein [Nocardiopsaceae bacterium]